jgi:hypothetical protein
VATQRSDFQIVVHQMFVISPHLMRKFAHWKCLYHKMTKRETDNHLTSRIGDRGVFVSEHV